MMIWTPKQQEVLWSKGRYMEKFLIPIIIAIIGSNAFFGFIQFMITRKDMIKKRFDELEKIIKYIDQGNVRLQIMVLIHLYPQRNEEIMKLGRKYFIEFGGNYYLTSIFKQYIEDNHLQYPTWWDDLKQ